MMYFTFIFLSWSPGIPRILRRCLALEREYCVNFEPYINDELSELVKTYGYRIEVKNEATGKMIVDARPLSHGLNNVR